MVPNMDVELESQLAEASARVQEASRQYRGLRKEIREIDDQLTQIHKRQDDLWSKRSKSSVACNDYLKSIDDTIIVPYSKAWNLDFANRMYSTLPRELRNMVYAYLWDDKDQFPYHDKISDVMMGRCCPPGFADAVCPCLERFPRPHFLRTEYIGPLPAYEMVELIYEQHWQLSGIPFTTDPKNIPRILQTDIFGVKLNPSSIVRGLSVECKLDRYRDSLHDIRQSKKSKKRFPEKNHVQIGKTKMIKFKEYFNLLLNVERRENFQLDVDLIQRNVRLSVLEEALEALEEARAYLLAGGAKVTITWLYRVELPKYPLGGSLEMDLSETFFNMPRAEWRRKMLKFWNKYHKCGDIRTCHARFTKESAQRLDETTKPEDVWESEENDCTTSAGVSESNFDSADSDYW